MSSLQAQPTVTVRNHPIRFGTGVAVSVVAGLLTAYLVSAIVGFVSNTWIEGEAEFFRFLFGFVGFIVFWLWIIGLGLIVLSRRPR